MAVRCAAICGPRPILLITRIGCRMVNSHDSDTDGHACAALEVSHLLYQVADDSVNLLDHCFREDLHLAPNFNGRNLSSSYDVARVLNGFYIGNQLPKSSIAAPSFDAATAVLHIQDSA